jgi:hypothetical protein
MLQGALLQNMRTRPDVMGTRFFAPLPSQKVPLYTLPPIVGSTQYSSMRGETLGTQFLRRKLGGGHLMGAGSVMGLSEPNGNSSQR